MPSYILRTIDPELWTRFKARSESEGIPMRALLLLLIEAYADGAINVKARRLKSRTTTAPPVSSETG